MPKKSRKCLPEPPKSLQKVSGMVWEVSGESSESVQRIFSDCSRDFLETFRGSGAGGPESHFQDFFVPNHGSNLRALLCCKNLCCASNFCMGWMVEWQGNWERQIQEFELRSRTPAAPSTRKPGQSAQAESTQGVFRVFPC